jgi:SAM-dependent methyltransferase
MIKQLKQFAKKSKLIIIAFNIYNNWRIKRQYNSGKLETSSGTTHLSRTLSESLRYIDDVFENYLRHFCISTEMLRGKRILEIGPGDNFGVALKFLATGAAQVVCLDKFYSKRDPEQQYKIYQALREKLDDGSRHRFDKAINLSSGIEINPEKLRYICGTGIEKAEELFEPKSFDLIISNAVIEHLYNTDAAFDAMNSLLVPGGNMVHVIDLRDHGMFSSNGMHPLTFLTIPDHVYRLMTIDSGKPNRRLISYYREKMVELEYDAKILITHIIGENGEVLPHKERIELNVDYSESTIFFINKLRSKLTDRFKDMSDEELMVSVIFLIARKPE